MGMSIKNTEVERLARELARLEGISMTEAIRRALEREVERRQAARSPKWDAAKRERINRIIEKTASLPILDTRSEDEILGYDEHGIPSR